MYRLKMYSCRLLLSLIIYILSHKCAYAEISESISSMNDGLQSDDESAVLEPIPHTFDYRFNVTQDQNNGKPWHFGRQIVNCVRPAKCERLQNSTCFGSKIPYKFTSLALTDATSQADSRAQLHMYEALRNIPKCWAVIQPFLCSVFMPKCERFMKGEMVHLPSSEMCRITIEPCRMLYNTSFFKPFLKCHEQNFPCRNSSNDVREMKFNVTGQCLSPLVQTESLTSHYKDVEGCGVQCKDPLFTDDEHESVRSSIFWYAAVDIACNIFVIVTFWIHDWKHSKYPAWNLFYISICFLFNWIGWTLQFLPGYRENIVCHGDGTLRHSEPGAVENLSCIISFILIYYSLIAATVWYAIFTYAWYLQTTDRGSIRDRIDNKNFYFHLIAWALPFVLTVLIMVLNEVDGNSIAGICFVGYRNRYMRIGLFDVPVGILALISVFFTWKGVFNLINIKSSSNESKKLGAQIRGMAIRNVFIILCFVGFFLSENYEIRNADTWAESFREFLICKIPSSYSSEPHTCKLKSRPSVVRLQLRLFCLFAVNLVISSWCLTRPAFRTWNRFIRKKLGREVKGEDVKHPKAKHRIIADAYRLRNNDVISVSIQNYHTDPAGLNFDMNNMNSTESDAMGATLTNYMYNMITRRNAVANVDFHGRKVNCDPYGSSCDSEISLTVTKKRYSFSVQESRRSSVDSQVSVKMSETEFTAKVESRSKKQNRANRSVKSVKAKKRNFTALRMAFDRNRRASSSSVESQRITNQEIQYRYPNRAILPNGNAMIMPADEMTSMFSQDAQPSNMLAAFDGSHNNAFVNFLRNNNDEASREILMSNFQCSELGLTPFTNNKSNRCSKKSSKNQLHSHAQSQRHIVEPLTSRLNELDDTTSLSSSVEITVPLNENNSSDSGQLDSRNKMPSQNSRDSCDVGTQANAYDITPHCQLQQLEPYDKELSLEKHEQNHEILCETSEMHQLLSNRAILPRKETLYMTESEKMKKIKQLLLP